MSDEPITGTDQGVVKCRASPTTSEDHRFDAKALEKMRGTPCRPSTRYPGSRIRTHIKDEYEEEDSGDDEMYEVKAKESDVDIIAERLKEAVGNEARRELAKYNLSIKAKDFFKYGATEGCIGCRFVMGAIAFQCGHRAPCKVRMTEAMVEDRVDMHRVEQWKREKGLRPEDDEKPTEEQMRRIETEEIPQGSSREGHEGEEWEFWLQRYSPTEKKSK